MSQSSAAHSMKQDAVLHDAPAEIAQGHPAAINQTGLESWQSRYDRLVGDLADYMYTVEIRQGQSVSTHHSPACLAVTGYTPDDFVRDPYLWINMVLPEDRERVRRHAAEVSLGGKTQPVEHRIQRKDGQIRWVRNISVPCFDQGGRLIACDGLVQDITERKLASDALAENEELFRTLAEFSSDMIFWHTPQGHLRYISSACLTLTGYTADELKSQPELFRTVIHSAGCADYLNSLQAGSSAQPHHPSEFSYLTKEGETRWVSHVCRPVINAKGECIGLRGSNRDITESKLAQEQLQRYMGEIKSANMMLELQKEQLQEQQKELLRANLEMRRLARQLSKSNTELSILARTDPLTRLLNRRAWEETVEHEHARSVRHESSFAILMIDVDHFKLYNDTKGHQAGDACLSQVASHISAVCRSHDYVGRYGGEEFVILAAETDRKQAIILAKRVRKAIEDAQIDHAANPVSPCVTVSVGVAISEHESWDATVGRADDALYRAKENGRNRIYTQPQTHDAPSR